MLSRALFDQLHAHNTPAENADAYRGYVLTHHAATGGRHATGPTPNATPSLPAAPAYDPYTDPTVQADISAYTAVPGQYNPALATSASSTAAALAPYSDTPIQETPVTSTPGNIQTGTDANGKPIYSQPQGITQYNFTVGPDGQLYRQLAVKTAQTYGARGVSSSSLVGDAYDTGHQALDVKKAGIETKGLATQATDTQKALDAMGKYSGDVGTALLKAQVAQQKQIAASAPNPNQHQPMSWAQFLAKHGGKATPKLIRTYNATWGNPQWQGYQG